MSPYRKPHLVAMKLLAGGGQDDEDIVNLFAIMSDPERDQALELARLIRRDKRLAALLEEL